ncbi:hypothetical protein CBR_g39292 [Chara braunii]|uniref:Uncharacterized protein n=1 Tax=Chara braunii TaxID=69332 RepID=A0A388K134_CHABU|nr:hypothetical protein CBR_g39292 [Chara braunii]|eukprot:GBG63748.1 hypothetical protein CBR_g39292 [Chara braunii]
MRLYDTNSQALPRCRCGFHVHDVVGFRAASSTTSFYKSFNFLLFNSDASPRPPQHPPLQRRFLLVLEVALLLRRNLLPHPFVVYGTSCTRRPALDDLPLLVGVVSSLFLPHRRYHCLVSGVLAASSTTGRHGAQHKSSPTDQLQIRKAKFAVHVDNDDDNDDGDDGDKGDVKNDDGAVHDQHEGDNGNTGEKGNDNGDGDDGDAEEKHATRMTATIALTMAMMATKMTTAISLTMPMMAAKMMMEVLEMEREDGDDGSNGDVVSSTRRRPLARFAARLERSTARAGRRPLWKARIVEGGVVQHWTTFVLQKKRWAGRRQEQANASARWREGWRVESKAGVWSPVVDLMRTPASSQICAQWCASVDRHLSCRRPW